MVTFETKTAPCHTGIFEQIPSHLPSWFIEKKGGLGMVLLLQIQNCSNILYLI